jgi:hypothetical protein
MARYGTVKTRREADTVLFQSLQVATDEDLALYPQVDGWRLDVDIEEQNKIEVYNTIDLLYENTPQYFIDKYLKVFNQLKINPEVEKSVSEFSSGWENVIGVHVRSWYCGRQNWHSNQTFVDEIEKLDSNSKIFLCTDNSNVSDYFIQKYGDRILKYPQNLYNTPNLAESGHNYNINDNINAFVDMLLLSKCSKIIGTFGSSFTECAWWFSGCNAKVIIPMPDNIPQDFISDVFSLK